jgi:toxin-antitoxin system PIN domain toxin
MALKAGAVPHLLDVNALIALGWERHAHHETMVTWFERHARAGWGTCALTQAGFVRVLSQPALGPAACRVDELADALAHNLSHPAHRFVPLDFDFAAVLACCSGGVVGHRQVTDAYLLTAAVRSGMKLLTFDSGLESLLASPAERRAHVEVLTGPV